MPKLSNATLLLAGRQLTVRFERGKVYLSLEPKGSSKEDTLCISMHHRIVGVVDSMTNSVAEEISHIPSLRNTKGYYLYKQSYSCTEYYVRSFRVSGVERLDLKLRRMQDSGCCGNIILRCNDLIKIVRSCLDHFQQSQLLH